MQQQQPPNSRPNAAGQSPLLPPQSNSLYHQQYSGYSHPGLHQSPYGSLDQSGHLNSAYGQSALNKNAAISGYPPGLGLLPPSSGNPAAAAAAANSMQAMPRRPTPTNQLPSHYQTTAALNSINSGRTAAGTMPNYNQNHSLAPYGASPYHHASPYASQMPSPVTNELWPGQLHQNRLPYPGGYPANNNSTQNSSPYLHSAAAAAAASTYSATQQALHSQAAARSAAYYGGGLPPAPPNNGSSSGGLASADNSLISNNSSAFNQSPYGRYGQQQPGAASAPGLPPGYHTGYSATQQPYSSSSSPAYGGYGKYTGKSFFFWIFPLVQQSL